MRFCSLISSLTKHNFNLISRRTYSSYPRLLNVLFFGNDDYSLETLKKLHANSCIVKSLEVVTSERKLKTVKKYALDHNLPLHHWPLIIPKGKYDVGVVAAFGHLIPEEIILAFKLGIINVHASLLPRWRGAAPAFHAILNGDKKTGISIMKIAPRFFDTGNILMQKSLPISNDIKTTELNGQLAQLGAEMLTECLENLPKALERSIPQNSLKRAPTKAPKVTPQMAKIDWEQTSEQMWRQYRALSGYFDLETRFDNRRIKLRKMLSPSLPQSLKVDEFYNKKIIVSPGSVCMLRKRNVLWVQCKDQWVGFELVLINGYPWMTAMEFFNGFVTKLPLEKQRFSN